MSEVFETNPRLATFDGACEYVETSVLRSIRDHYSGSMKMFGVFFASVGPGEEHLAAPMPRPVRVESAPNGHAAHVALTGAFRKLADALGACGVVVAFDFREMIFDGDFQDYVIAHLEHRSGERTWRAEVSGTHITEFRIVDSFDHAPGTWERILPERWMN